MRNFSCYYAVQAINNKSFVGTEHARLGKCTT